MDNINKFKQIVPIFLRAICEAEGNFSYKEVSFGKSVRDEITTGGHFDQKKAEDVQVCFCDTQMHTFFENAIAAEKIPYICTTFVLKTSKRTEKIPAKGQCLSAFFFCPGYGPAVEQAYDNFSDMPIGGEIPAKELEEKAKRYSKQICAISGLNQTELDYVKKCLRDQYSIIEDDTGFSLYFFSQNAIMARKKRKEALIIWNGREQMNKADENNIGRILREIVNPGSKIIVYNGTGNGEYSYINAEGASLRVFLDETVELDFIPRGTDYFDQKVFDAISNYQSLDYVEAKNFEKDGILPEIITDSVIREKARETSVSEIASPAIIDLAPVFVDAVEKIIRVKKKLEEYEKSEVKEPYVDLGDTYKKIPQELSQKVLYSINKTFNISSINELTDPSKTKLGTFFSKLMLFDFLKDEEKKALQSSILSRPSAKILKGMDETEMKEFRRTVMEGMRMIFSAGSEYDISMNIDINRSVQRALDREAERVQEVE